MVAFLRTMRRAKTRYRTMYIFQNHRSRVVLWGEHPLLLVTCRLPTMPMAPTGSLKNGSVDSKSKQQIPPLCGHKPGTSNNTLQATRELGTILHLKQRCKAHILCRSFQRVGILPDCNQTGTTYQSYPISSKPCAQVGVELDQGHRGYASVKPLDTASGVRRQKRCATGSTKQQGQLSSGNGIAPITQRRGPGRPQKAQIK